ncbi:hypothetical protein [Verrucomicrobium spinosum]|uniref:ATPase, T2SS/T4P/T4SS family n=1 Tax=Verrucomicrobium spinosum TaxID=2736 RepID=UPI000AD00D15|nr:hypothetical protein [Verrucomicrobium spinosum]
MDEFSLEIPDFDVTRQYEEPIAQLVASMVSDAIKLHASDIHIKTEKTSIAYSYRIDGDLGSKVEMPVKLRDRIDAFLLNLMRLPPEERNKRPGISGVLPPPITDVRSGCATSDTAPTVVIT